MRKFTSWSVVSDLQVGNWSIIRVGTFDFTSYYFKLEPRPFCYCCCVVHVMTRVVILRVHHVVERNRYWRIQNESDDPFVDATESLIWSERFCGPRLFVDFISRPGKGPSAFDRSPRALALPNRTVFVVACSALSREFSCVDRTRARR